MFCSCPQGPPGVPGLKGESGEAGPQVRHSLTKVKMDKIYELPLDFVLLRHRIMLHFSMIVRKGKFKVKPLSLIPSPISFRDHVVLWDPLAPLESLAEE